MPYNFPWSNWFGKNHSSTPLNLGHQVIDWKVSLLTRFSSWFRTWGCSAIATEFESRIFDVRAVGSIERVVIEAKVTVSVRPCASRTLAINGPVQSIQITAPLDACGISSRGLQHLVADPERLNSLNWAAARVGRTRC